MTATVLAVASPAVALEHEQVSVFEAGGLSDRTLEAVDTISGVLGVTPTLIHSGTLRMLRVDRDDEVVQSFRPGFAVPMTFQAVDPTAAVRLLGADVAGALTFGVVMSEATAELRGARAGDQVTLEGWDGSVRRYPVAAVIEDARLQWAELLFTTATAAELGIDRPSQAVMWGVSPTMVDLLAQAVLPDIPIRVRGPASEFIADWVLPMVEVKRRFGEFSFRELGGDRIETDDAWFDANIVTLELPRLGLFRCHRAIVPALRGALAELEARGLADEIDSADFQAAGGCYNARLARGGDFDRGFALSRHSWGIAIDFNPTSNQFGDPSTLSEGFGQVFRDRGFAWGAGWLVGDPMHFEWHASAEDTGCAPVSWASARPRSWSCSS